MNTERKFGLFGIVSEAGERAKALANYRSQIPAPTNCTEALNALAKLRTANADVDARIIKEGNNRPKEREKYAISTLVSEYTDYYNSHECAAVSTSITTTTATDNVLAGAVVPQTSIQQQPSAINPQPSIPLTNVPIPSWVWYGGVGLLAVIVLVVILKPRSAT